MKEKGKLQLFIHAMHGLLPVAEATVQVTGGDAPILCRAGEGFASLTVETPPFLLSQRPFDKRLPFAELSVRVAAPGFLEQHVRGVRVFPFRTTLCKIDLIPCRGKGRLRRLSAANTAARDANAALTLRPLAAQTPLSPPAAASLSPISLFTYIQALCAASVYPTWPEETIRAVALLQTSNTLRRLAEGEKRLPFSGGAGVLVTYENVSAVAEEVFLCCLQAARPQEVRIPLWQCRQLGELGYRGLSILERYAPGLSIRHVGDGQAALREGDTGPSVAVLRRRLARLGYLDADAGHGMHFDEAARQAVAAFQRANALRPDGLAGKATLHCIAFADGMHTRTKRAARPCTVDGKSPACV